MIIDGKTGVLVKPGDAGELAKGILAMLNSPGQLERMGANARAHAIEAFQLTRFVRELESVYNELMIE